MSKEAMKLALEALELVNLEFVCANGSHHAKKDRHEWDEDCPITNRCRKAITVLQEALAEQPAQQEPVAWYRDEDGIRMYYESKVWDDATPLYTSPPTLSLAQRPHKCSRSHPHENMNAMCELRTEIARLTNENARLKALHQDDEINTYRMTLLCIRDGLQQGMSKSIQKLQAREINDVLGLPSFASYRTSPPAQRKPLTDEEWQSIADTLGCIITRGQKDAIEATIGIKENT